MPTHDDFFQAVLGGAGLPVRRAGLRSLAAVSLFESSLGDNRWYNPLAVTLYQPGAIAYNSFGDDLHVWCYPSFTTGVAATVALLSGSHWAGVRAELVKRRWRRPILEAFRAAYTWAPWVDFTVYSTAELDARRAHPLH